MLNWFYSWLDPRILRVEEWVNARVIDFDKIDIDLDKVKKGEVRDNPMFRTPPDTGNNGPFLVNLQGAKTIEWLHGPGKLEAFALLDFKGERWWRHRDAGTTEDFRAAAFENMREFFTYAIGDAEKYWDCVLRTKALQNEAE
jgi:hypothetical protein